MTHETVLREFRCTSDAEGFESSGFYNHERMAGEILQLRAQLAGVRERVEALPRMHDFDNERDLVHLDDVLAALGGDA